MSKDDGKKVKKKNFEGKEVEVLGSTYEKGNPESSDCWRGKLRNREEMIKYLQTAERYWFSDDWYGSEKRKTPA